MKFEQKDLGDIFEKATQAMLARHNRIAPDFPLPQAELCRQASVLANDTIKALCEVVGGQNGAATTGEAFEKFDTPQQAIHAFRTAWEELKQAHAAEAYPEEFNMREIVVETIVDFYGSMRPQ